MGWSANDPPVRGFESHLLRWWRNRTCTHGRNSELQSRQAVKELAGLRDPARDPERGRIRGAYLLTRLPAELRSDCWRSVFDCRPRNL